MSIDLLYLTLSAGLCAVLWIPYILSRIQTWGLINAVGYPENPPEVPAWAQRSAKVHANMVENLAPFAALVLVAQVAGLGIVAPHRVEVRLALGIGAARGRVEPEIESGADENHVLDDVLALKGRHDRAVPRDVGKDDEWEKGAGHL